METVRLKPLSENAVIVQFGDMIDPATAAQVFSFCEQLAKKPFDGLVEWVPSYHNVCLYVEPYTIYRQTKLPIHVYVEEQIAPLVASIAKAEVRSGRLIEIPVRYGGEDGPDLCAVASYHDMTKEEVIARHSNRELIVYMLGFAPGFAFLGGMDEALATPRRDKPRLKITPGSVAIGGAQTAVYPLETPGGWHIIGRTDMAMFLPNAPLPSLLRAGDRVQFIPI